MNAREEKRHFFVGLIAIIIALIVLIATAVFAEPYYFSPKIVTETYFTDSVNGLEVGNPVKFRGIPIGQIIKIGLTADLYPQDGIMPFENRESLAVVRMLLYFDKEQFTQQLPKYIVQGLRAQTQLEGLTGTQYISLDFLEPSRYKVGRQQYAWTPAYPVIPSAPSLTNEIGASLQNFLASLSDLKSDGNFKDTLPAIQGLVVQLDKLSAGITGDTINQVLTNVDKLLKTADVKVEDVDVQKVNGLINQLTSTAEHISDLTEGDQTQKIVAQLNDLTKKFNSFASGNQYGLRNLMTSLASLTQGLVDLTRELNNNPGFFLTRRAQTRLLND